LGQFSVLSVFLLSLLSLAFVLFCPNELKIDIFVRFYPK
jgi:hypothetical protein